MKFPNSPAALGDDLTRRRLSIENRRSSHPVYDGAGGLEKAKSLDPARGGFGARGA
jgi:hypothetical protein